MTSDPASPGSGAIRVLLVEDDDRLASLTARYLDSHGLVVTRASDGASGLATARSGGFDVVLLDLMLPGKSGLEVCRALRTSCAVPIIMVTALGDETDRVLGLEVGADDYVTKPFSSPELLARIRAVVRRARGEVGPGHGELVVGDLRLDPGGLRAHLGDRDLELTAHEFAILHALAVRAGRVLSRDQIMDALKGHPLEAFDRSIDVHVSRIRACIEDDPKSPQRVLTVRGAGYVFARKQDSD